MNKHYEQLLQIGDYETVIALSNGQTDHDSLLARLIALTKTGQDQQALMLIDNYFDTLKTSVKIIFPLHAGIIKQRHDKLAGFKMLARYFELPYTSIEVEEAMHEFEEWLHQEEKTPSFDLQKWKLMLINFDRNVLEKAVNSLPTALIEKQLATIKKLLVSPYPQAIRFLALQRLISVKLAQEVAYGVDDLIINVIPAMLDEPLSSVDATNFMSKLEAYKTEPSEIELARQLLAQYAIAIYPLEPPFEDEHHLLEAIYLLVKRYLGLSQPLISDVSKALVEEIETSLACL